MVELNRLTSNYILGGTVNVAWLLGDHTVSSPPICSLPGSNVELFTLKIGGRRGQRISALVCALHDSLSFGRTCYRVACQGEQPSFLDLCDTVKDMSPATWLQLKAECKRAVKDQKSDNRQTLIHLWHSELREFLEGMWSASSFSKTPSDPDFVSTSRTCQPQF